MVLEIYLNLIITIKKTKIIKMITKKIIIMIMIITISSRQKITYHLNAEEKLDK